jgi:6-pyruvoyltetrahydropterin/6-carboxytetrahydropterin synthase
MLWTYAITVEAQFPASHQLRLYDDSLEPIHEHLWRVKLTAVSPQLDSIGVVMDFHELERLLETLVAPLRNQSLNAHPAFTATNPSTENIAAYIANHLTLPHPVRLESVEVWETPGNSAIVRISAH